MIQHDYWQTEVNEERCEVVYPEAWRSIVKICLYSYEFPPRVGGLATFTSNLADYFTSQGETVTVLTQAPSSFQENPSYKLVRRPSWVEILKEVAESDVVHLNGFALLPALLAVVLRRPIVWAHYEYDTICPIGMAWWNGAQRTFRFGQCVACMRVRGLGARIPKRFLVMFVRRIFAHLVTVNIQPSRFILERQGQPKSVFVPHAIDTSIFNPPASDSNGRGHFLYCGRLIEEKGVHILLRAIQICRRNGYDVNLRVRGEGQYDHQLRGLASSLELNGAVSFGNFAHGSELVDELRGAYALVVPSIWDEVTGIVAMEAMACGTPVIAANVGGLGELAKKGGLVVERNDPDSLAEAMTRLYTTSSLRDQLAQDAAHSMAHDYSLESIGARHLSILHNLSMRTSERPIGD